MTTLVTFLRDVRRGWQILIDDWRPQVWRDVDSERRHFGICLWATGGEMRLGHRLYRWRYAA